MAYLFNELPPTAGLPLSAKDFLPSKSSLEVTLAAFLKQSTVQIECSGTVAIVVALTTLKRFSSRRSVIIPAYTCPFVPLAILRCGLKPIICDTKKHHFDFCLNALENVCDQDTLAIMPTHLGGRVADLGGIIKIAQQCGAYIVEDAAQALGALWQGQLVGTLGDIGCFSLGVGKGLTIYGGGGLIARDDEMKRALKVTHAEIVPFKLTCEVKHLIGLIGYYVFYRPLGLGLVFGIPLRKKLKQGKLIEAVGDDCSVNFPVYQVGRWRKSIGARSLQRLASFLTSTREIALSRIAILSKINGIRIMIDADGDVGTWPYLLILMPTLESRDSALAELWPAGLGVGRLFIHALCDYDYLPFRNAQTPNAREFAEQSLTITNSPWLSDDEFMKIYEVLERIIG